MGTLSVLGIVQEFCGLRGLPVPTALYGATSAEVVQYRALLNQVLREVVSQPWPEVKAQASFTTVATPAQGLLTDLFPGFSSFVDNTLWLESQTLPVNGPLTDAAWAAITALDITGPPYSYWLSQGQLYLTPTPPAGATFSAIYYTDYKYMNGTTPKVAITADSDTVIAPDSIMIDGLCAFWAKVKGLEWEADMRFFQTRMAQALAPSLPKLQLDSTPSVVGPRVFVPPGSWNV